MAEEKHAAGSFLTRPALAIEEVQDRLVGEGCPFDAVERDGPFALRLTDHDGSVYRLRIEAADPFPLLEEVADPAGLPTVGEWLRAGAPLREVS